MEKRLAMAALRKVADENGVSLKTVLEEIELVIEEGIHAQDPVVRQRWAEIPCAGEVPTPVELMTYLTRLMYEQRGE